MAHCCRSWLLTLLAVLQAAAVGGQTSVLQASYVLSTAPAGLSPASTGINGGHNYDPSWLAWISRLGVKGNSYTRAALSRCIAALHCCIVLLPCNGFHVWEVRFSSIKFRILYNVCTCYRMYNIASLAFVFAAMRVFGLAGTPQYGTTSTLQAWVVGGPLLMPVGVWGADLTGAAVTNLTTWKAAVALLRTPAAHNTTNPSSYPNPPRWAAFDLMLNTTTAAADGLSMQGIVQGLQSVNVEPLLVFWMGCGVFSVSTMNPAQPAYWAERWELYKHQYMGARWAFVRGVRRLEFWHARPAMPHAGPPPPASLQYLLLRQTRLRPWPRSGPFSQERAGPEQLLHHPVQLAGALHHPEPGYPERFHGPQRRRGCRPHPLPSDVLPAHARRYGQRLCTGAAAPAPVGVVELFRCLLGSESVPSAQGAS